MVQKARILLAFMVGIAVGQTIMLWLIWNAAKVPAVIEPVGYWL